MTPMMEAARGQEPDEQECFRISAPSATARTGSAEFLRPGITKNQVTAHSDG